jgi:hypothetical protein
LFTTGRSLAKKSIRIRTSHLAAVAVKARAVTKRRAVVAVVIKLQQQQLQWMMTTSQQGLMSLKLRLAALLRLLLRSLR